MYKTTEPCIFGHAFVWISLQIKIESDYVQKYLKSDTGQGTVAQWWNQKWLEQTHARVYELLFLGCREK